MTNAIVFGGSGFLGSHVADALTEIGYNVTIYDLNPSPYLKENQTMIVGDILDEKHVSNVIDGMDYVFHFAGFADLDDATTKPLETVSKNVAGTVILLEAVRDAQPKRFVYASTVYVHSNKGGFYRCSKQAAEAYIEEYHACFGIDYTILRYGTLYGPRADERNSIYRYVKQALIDGKIVCFGNGDEIREYIHVKDAAKLSLQILDEKYKNTPVTITGHHPMKFRDLLNMIREMHLNKIDVMFSPKEDRAHYTFTPYSFIPKIGLKLTSNYYHDIGQGLLECIDDVYCRVNGRSVYVTNKAL